MIAGQLRSGPPAYIYWQCRCGWTSACYDPDYPNARRSAYDEWCAHSACAHGAIAMARDGAETACPAPVPQDCPARAEGIAQMTASTPLSLDLLKTARMA